MSRSHPWRVALSVALVAVAAACSDSNTELDTNALASTDACAMAWTGERLVVVGRDVAGAWDPGTDAWTSLPVPPGHLEAAHVLWAGDEVVVVGVSCASRDEESATVTCSPGGVEAARLDDDDRWTRVPPSDDGIFAELPDRDVSVQTAVWDGSDVVGIVDGHVFSLDVASAGWDDLGRLPMGHADVLCPTQDGVVAVNVAEKADLEEGPSVASVLRRRRWSGEQRSPEPASTFATGTCMEDGAVSAPSRSTSAASEWFDVDDGWTALPPPPIELPDLVRTAPGGPASALFAGRDGRLWELDTSRRQWRQLEATLSQDDALVAWTADGLIIRRTAGQTTKLELIPVEQP